MLVYFAQSNGRYLNIHRSSDLIRDLAALNARTPSRIRLLGVLPGDRLDDIRSRFSRSRVSGDWYRPTRALLDFITSECKRSDIPAEARRFVGGSTPRPVRLGRGRPPTYVMDAKGKPVVGLSLHTASGRLYATHSRPRVYFGRDFTTALSRYRLWEKREARKSRVILPEYRSLIAEQDIEASVAEGWISREAAEKLVPWPVHVRLEDFAAQARRLIQENPSEFGEILGLPDFARYVAETQVRQGTDWDLSALWDVYEKATQATASWMRKQRRFWKEFCALTGRTKLGELTRDDLRRYFDSIRAKAASPTFVHHRAHCVRTVLSVARKHLPDSGTIAAVLEMTRSWDLPRKAPLKPCPVTPAQFQSLLDVCQHRPRWKAVLLLSLNAGLYPGELADVRKADVDLESGTMRMIRSKTSVARVCVLWPRTVAAIRSYMAHEPHNREELFLNDNGGPLTASYVSRHFRRLRAEAGLPSAVQFAGIRDATQTAAMSGRSVRIDDVRLLLGHRTGISDHYLLRSPGLVAEACKAVEAAFFSAPGEASARAAASSSA